MKKSAISVILMVCIVLLVACGSQPGNSNSADKNKPEQNDKKDSGAKSPVGVYSAVEDGNPMQFTLNEDGSGFENYKGIEKRPFNWKTKAEGIFFTYTGETQEFQLPIDVVKGEIKYGSLVYKKE